MSWYALGAVDDAMDATRGFLFPFDRGRWVRLAVISAFVGGGSLAFSLVRGVPFSPVPAEAPADPVEYLAAVDLVALVAVVLVTALALSVVVAGPVMRFVLLDALRTDRVSVRDRFRRRFRKGVRLLVFTVVTGVLLLVTLVALFLALTSGGVAILQDVPNPAGSLVGLAVVGFGVVLGLLAALCLSVFFHFTVAFVPPTMVATDSGVVAAWGRFYGVLREEFAQFVGYVFARFFLGVAVLFLRLLVVALFAGAVAVIAFLLGLATTAAGRTVNLPAAVLSGGTLAWAGVLIVAGVYVLLVELPLRIALLTFFTSYELAVLGAADERLAILGVGGRSDAAAGPDGSGTEETGVAGRNGATTGPAVDERGFVFDVARPADDARRESPRGGDSAVDDPARASSAGSETGDRADPAGEATAHGAGERDADGLHAEGPDGNADDPDADGESPDSDAEGPDPDAEEPDPTAEGEPDTGRGADDEDDEFSTPFWRS